MGAFCAHFFGQLLRVLWFEEASIFPFVDNIERSTVPGGNDWGVHGERFDEGEPKTFGFF